MSPESRGARPGRVATLFGKTAVDAPRGLELAAPGEGLGEMRGASAKLEIGALLDASDWDACAAGRTRRG